jgi:hypothetical protein
MCSAEKNRLHKVQVDTDIHINVVVGDIHVASARASIKAFGRIKPCLLGIDIQSAAMLTAEIGADMSILAVLSYAAHRISNTPI